MLDTAYEIDFLTFIYMFDGFSYDEAYQKAKDEYLADSSPASD